MLKNLGCVSFKMAANPLNLRRKLPPRVTPHAFKTALRVLDPLRERILRTLRSGSALPSQVAPRPCARWWRQAWRVGSPAGAAVPRLSGHS